MSNLNGKIFIDTTTSPHTGVSVADVQQVLRRGTGDIGLLCSDQEWYDNNGTPALRRVGKINGWAKYKPIRSNILAVLADADFQDAYFGLQVPIYGTGHTTDISTFLAAFASAYAYLPPRGKGNGASGADEWFRLLDFNGYNKAANPFVFESGCTLPHNYEYGGAGSSGVNFILSLNTGASLNDGIAIGDWKVGGHSGTAFNTYYFGLIFKHGNDTPKIITSSYAMNDSQSRGLTINIGDSGNDGLDGLNTSYTYTVYPVLSRVSHSSMSNVGNSSSETLVALPMKTFQFSQYPASAGVTYNMIAADAYQGPYARLVISATIGINSTGGYSTISANHLQLFRASSDTDTTGTQIGSTYDIGTITTTDPVSFNPSPIALDNFPSYVRIHLYNDSVSGMELDYWVLVREDEF